MTHSNPQMLRRPTKRDENGQKKTKTDENKTTGEKDEVNIWAGE